MKRARKSSAAATPKIPVSWGELIDKLTILQIKQERMTGRAALANVAKELGLLGKIARPLLAGDAMVRNYAAQLKSLNEKLWDIEEHIRVQEDEKRFGAEFIKLARAVYKRNDARGALKRKINLHLKSELVEEKSYKRRK